MLDNIYPEVSHLHNVAARVDAIHQYWPGSTKSVNGKAKKKASSPPPGAMNVDLAAAQVPEIAVHCATWSKSIRRAAVVASGAACGLVRIDMTEGPPTDRMYSFTPALCSAHSRIGNIGSSRANEAEGEDEIDDGEDAD